MRLFTASRTQWMSLIAALLPNERDRESLRGARPSTSIVWVDSWQDLTRTVRTHPVTLAITDLNAEPRRDGALRVFRFHRRYPHTPIVVWMEPDGRDLFRVGKAGAADVVLSRDAGDAELIAEVVSSASPRPLSEMLADRLSGRLDADALDVLRHASDHVPRGVQVPDVAQSFEMSVSTLERRCERWGMPSPGRMLLWLRVLHGIAWLLEPGRSVESVAVQLGYSSGAAFRRAIKATIGGRPTPLRSSAGSDLALAQFLTEFSGND